MAQPAADIGLIGLGTMGANLSLNIADNGCNIAVYNRTSSKTEQFHKDAGDLAKRIVPCTTLSDLIDALKPPRAIILMVPAGAPVDQQIEALKPLLAEEDLIIDAGNANFRDTRKRASQLADEGPLYLGIGVSGGEEGARFGPSIMGGGERSSWERVKHVLEAISAKHEGTPCATWMGNDGAGHFVKTIHNGIEYADMQMIAETYGIFRDGMNMPASAISDVFGKWDQGTLKSYLIEISGKVTSATDTLSGNPIIDMILDKAGQKGTGRWTAIEAQHLAAPATVIEAAVAARNMSARLDERTSGENRYGAAPQLLDGEITIDDLEGALIAGKIICYAQGFELLEAASAEFGWGLPMPEIAKVWRAGCIIRSAMLNDMASALETNPGLNLMHAEFFSDLLKANVASLRKTVVEASRHGLPVPALSAALSYFDIMRTKRSTANMIQAQRDYFGAHSFERIDQEGSHHGPWGN